MGPDGPGRILSPWADCIGVTCPPPIDELLEKLEPFLFSEGRTGNGKEQLFGREDRRRPSGARAGDKSRGSVPRERDIEDGAVEFL